MMVDKQQWLVLIVAYLGWMLDAMDATLYILVQTPALEELLNDTSKENVSHKGGIILAFFLVGAAAGGVVFGVLSDKFGRSLMMMITILIYSVCSGLCAFVGSWQELAVLRFLTGVGTGGEWACGVSLVAEVWPDKYRTIVGPVLQSGGGAGDMLAALVYSMAIPYGWRAVFLVGLLPALLAVVMRCFVDESEMWEQAKARSLEAGHDTGFLHTLEVIFSKAHLRDTLSLTTLMTVIMTVFWSTSGWVPSVVRDLVRQSDDPYWEGKEDRAVTYATLALHIGAVASVLSWVFYIDRVGRKVGLALYCVVIMFVTPVLFLLCRTPTLFIALVPTLGLVSGIRGGLTVYLPELFPTEVRSTGTAFITNIGRVVAATGPMIVSYLVSVTDSYGDAVAIMPLLYIVGLIALLFPKETRGQPLPA